VNDNGFSEDLEEFVRGEIQSLEQLEILLLLSGNPHKWWTAKSVYDVVKSSTGSVEDRLKDFASRGILKSETGNELRYQFSPAEEKFWRILSELREAYKERPVKVVQAIYSQPPDPAKEFARAFRIRKEEGR
jgi:hypothetical protein